MISDLNRTFVPNEYFIKFVTQDWEYHQMRTLRQDVFCEEQGIFSGDDWDDIDNIATHIVAIACVGGLPDQVVGTVRIHQSAPRYWWGSRLAVAQDYRKQGQLGAVLIRLAVTSANEFGCDTFMAQVQKRNTAFFRRLHWAFIEEIPVHGRPHSLMQAELNWYPPYANGSIGFVTTSRVAA